MFDLSRASANDRWRAGELDMSEALRRTRDAAFLCQRGCELIAVRRTPDSAQLALERVA
jgi:hypothetical protein